MGRLYKIFHSPPKTRRQLYLYDLRRLVKIRKKAAKELNACYTFQKFAALFIPLVNKIYDVHDRTVLQNLWLRDDCPSIGQTKIAVITSFAKFDFYEIDYSVFPNEICGINIKDLSESSRYDWRINPLLIKQFKLLQIVRNN
uniref:Uncharacterized protein n=1 Tax=Abalone asfa-like virus TaxID=2839893 RepID=A0A5K7XY70_9VIRU|nr:hypothetical protein [Abalone asfa-like virus]BCY04639.1 hypothetical protein [Abalone asfa-like virus]